MKAALTLLVLIVLAMAITRAETHGFFLKINGNRKNIPRLGRRSGNDQLMLKADKNMRANDDNFSQLFGNDEVIRTKRMLDSRLNDPLSYNTIQPASTNVIYDMVSKDLLSRGNFKFVSWKDLDRALEQDDELYLKMHAIAKDPNLQYFAEKVGYNNVIQLYDTPANNDVLFYRTDRSSNFNSKDMN